MSHIARFLPWISHRGWIAIRADCTVTFVAAKKGFAKAGAAAYTGEVYIASIGVERRGELR